MASRKLLKKSIKFISVELITESYVKYSLFPNISKEKIAEIIQQVNKLNYDLVARINHTDGKGNNKVTKAFYKKLIEDWNAGVTKIADEIEKLGK